MSRRMGKMSTATEVTWTEAMKEFLFWKGAQGLSENTLEGYRDQINVFFRRFPSWGGRGLKTDILQHMSQKVKPATYNLRLVYLKSFFDWCIDRGYMPDNPLKGFRRRKAAPRIVEVPEDVLKKLLDLPDQRTFAGLRDYALLLITLDTGIRPKEAFSLTPANIDLARSKVTIPADQSKTRETRILPLLTPTVEAVRRLIAAHHPEWVNAHVFCGHGGRQMNQRFWGDRMEYYSDLLGLRIRPYDLRHCFAIYYLRGGGHVFGLQKSLGHVDLSMTKRYLNITGQDLAEIHKTASPLHKLTTSPRKRKV